MATSFNYSSFKSGNLAINGLGQEVRFLCETRGQMLVSVKHKYGNPEPMKLNIDGTKYLGTKTAYDLVGMKEAA